MTATGSSNWTSGPSPGTERIRCIPAIRGKGQSAGARERKPPTPRPTTGPRPRPNRRAARNLLPSPVGAARSPPPAAAVRDRDRRTAKSHDPAHAPIRIPGPPFGIRRSRRPTESGGTGPGAGTSARTRAGGGPRRVASRSTESPPGAAGSEALSNPGTGTSGSVQRTPSAVCDATSPAGGPRPNSREPRSPEARHPRGAPTNLEISAGQGVERGSNNGSTSS